MIAELGLAALWLAAALAATQMVAGFLAVRDNGTSELAKLIRPAAIAQGGADIILLQEIYEQKHVDAVLAAAKPAGYVHHARGDPRTRPWIQFHNGLLCLSKLLPLQAQVRALQL